MVNENASFRPRTRSGFPMDRYGPVATKKKRLPPLHAIVARSTALVRRIAGKIVLLTRIGQKRHTPVSGISIYDWGEGAKHIQYREIY